MLFSFNPDLSDSQANKTPFNKALSAMSLELVIDDVPGALDTPACKKPRRAEKTKAELVLAPPDVVGSQTVS